MKHECQDLARSLHAFVDGELDPNQSIAIQEHIENCSACQARVVFARASRSSVKRLVRGTSMPAVTRARISEAMIIARASTSDAQGATWNWWAVALPLSAAAAIVGVWLASRPEAAPADFANASLGGPHHVLPTDDYLDSLIDQHANPLPIEAKDEQDIAKLESYVGVPVQRVFGRPSSGDQDMGKLLGVQAVPLRGRHAAMFRYQLADGKKASLYVYDPKRLRIASPQLRQQMVDSSSVYAGYVRGYAVALTDRKGVGYAIASDLDENQTVKLVTDIDR